MMNSSDRDALDRIDLKMLDIIQSDGRITNKELAEAVNLSASACHQRLQKLTDQGWINHFMGVVDIDRLCSPVQCIATISLNTHSPDSFRLLESRVAVMPEALEAYTVSGASDFIVRFVCEHMARYMELTDDLIRECPEIGNISSHVVMRQSKKFQGYPVKNLLSGRNF
ncbi:MAG: Lrp/AsnC family transcriptional regulator [Pseudomonadales bacterium]|nr:Lrp/AsnC family transcriptional regulator [Pseudomonadales bacterium]